MLKRAVRDQIISMLGTLQEGVQYVQQAKVFMAKKIFFDSVVSLESIIAATQEGLTPARHAEYQEIFSRLLPLFRSSKINEGEFIEQNLVQLISMFETEQEICKEILFLPYKASMWDSLESIWIEANDDADCECYVIPIPYCDRKPDGSVAKWHYEGDIFPADVPITSFEAYDIAQRKPDIIYFHNPYDDYNRVTSVHPAYYSQELKKHTQKLVYIPYFVTDGNGVGEHFCQTPGVMNADIVVVQSEKVKEVYAKYISAEKVLALGSPKFDKVIWNQQHKPAMPQEWEKIAHGRKLILYNTHLTPLMIDDGSVCRKLRYVFSCFEGRDDVCLLWRPHPLSEATMQAMNPSALAEYHRIVEEYKKSGLGIYDESPDVHRAIALSDAYYGDTSSLVPMYEVTGKPIMLQNLEIDEEISEENIRSLPFMAAIVEDNFMWFSGGNLNGLFKMDMVTQTVDFIAKFPSEGLGESLLHSDVIKYQDKLFFIPNSAQAIAKFDMRTCEVKEYALPLPYREGNSKFSLAFIDNGWIWLFPCCSHAIIKFNIDTGIFQVYDDWYNDLRPFIKNERGAVFGRAVKIEDSVWFPFIHKNIIGNVNLKNGQMHFYHVGNSDDQYRAMTYDGEFFWLIPMSSRALIKWNPQNNSTIEYTKFPHGFKETGCDLGLCAYVCGFVWVFSTVGSKVIKVNVQNGNMTEYKQYPKHFKCYQEGRRFFSRFSRIKVKDDQIIVFPGKANMVLQINARTEETEGKKVVLAKKEWEQLSERNFFQEKFICNTTKRIKCKVFEQEGRYYSIASYMHFVSDVSALFANGGAKHWVDMVHNTDESNGEKIHHACK